MRKRLPICIVLSLFIFEACGDGDDRERQTDLECVPGTYASKCVTETSHTVCEDDRIVIKDCTGGTVCQNGVCAIEGPVQGECDPKSYVSVCADETHRTLCSAGNAVTRERCPEGTQCAGGECVKTATCTENDFKPECTDDKHRTVCQDGKKQTQECEGEAVCLGGECTTKKECTPGNYLSECQGEKQYTVCTDAGKIESRACEGETVCDGGVCVKEKQCDPNKYKSKCIDATHYTACLDAGDEVILECENDLACHLGGCHPKDCDDVGCLCDVDNFLSSCENDMYTVCESGLVTEYKCSDTGLVCYEGVCSAIGTIECDPNTFVDKCMGDTHVYCDNYSLYGMSRGFGYLGTTDCKRRNSSCAVVDGIIGCYRSCTEHDYKANSNQICESDSVGDYIEGQCVKTTDQRYLFVQKSNRTLCSSDNTVICKDGECVQDEKLETQCDLDTAKSFCDGDRLYYCNSDGYFNVYSCIRPTVYKNYPVSFAGHAKCMEVNNVADCYMPCQNEGDYFYDIYRYDYADALKYECTATENGLYYIKKQAECYDVIDSELLIKQRYGQGYARAVRYGDVCVHKLTESDEEVCDGNIAKYVQEIAIVDTNGDLVFRLFEVPIDCGINQCVIHEGSPICAEKCSSKDVNQVKYLCTIDSDDYVSNAYQCTKIDDDYYWIYTGHQTCGHGCNEKIGCLLIHPAEGKACTEFDNSELMDQGKFCSENIYLECGYNKNVKAYDCGTKTCGFLEDYYGCFESCDPKDVSKKVDVCMDGRSIHKTCQKSADGKYLELTNWAWCKHGCDSNTGRCIKSHSVEGEACDPDESLYGCAGDSIMKCVEDVSGKFEGVWKIDIDCTKEEANIGAPSGDLTCVEYDSSFSCKSKCTADEIGQIKKHCENTDFKEYAVVYECRQSEGSYYWKQIDYEYCIHGCNADKTACLTYHPDEGKSCDESEFTAKCVDKDTIIRCEYGRYLAEKCTPGICTETDGLADCSYACTQSDIDDQVIVETCLDRTYHRYKCYLLDGEYSWNFTRRISCAHGCHTNGKECARVHKDEYSSCIESRCDGTMLLDCVTFGEVSLYQAVQCQYQCDAGLRCYEPCSTVGVTKECIDSHEKYNMCIEDEKKRIKYKQERERYCEHGCNEVTNACLATHEKEYSECGVWESKWEGYRNGGDLCDGQFLLECRYDYFAETEHSYRAIDCGTNGKCSPSYGCYLPCETPGEVHYCRDSEISMSDQCIEDSEHQIMRLEGYGLGEVCEKGCDEGTGKCK